MLSHQRFSRIALPVLAASATLLCGPSLHCQSSTPDVLAITGATLIDGSGSPPRSDTTILVRDGRISGVVADSEAEVPPGATILDAAGRYVIPGLADVHVHFGPGYPRHRGPETIDVVLARELYYGVTTILQLGGSGGSTDSIRALRARRAAGELASPSLYGTGGHLTLQGTHPVYTIFPPPVREAADTLAAKTPLDEPVNLYRLGIGVSIVRTEEAARKAVRERAIGGMDAIKITVESGPTTFGDDHPQMSVEMIRAITTEAKKHGLRVFAHVTSIDEMEAALEGGASGAVHAVWDRPYPDARLADRMAAAGFAVAPTLSLFRGPISLRYINEPIDLDDPFLREMVSDEAVAALRSAEFVERFRAGGRVELEAGSDPAESIRLRMAGLLANVRMLHERGVPIVLGTDTGNPYVFPGYSVHVELELLVLAGLTPMEALEAASRGAAEMIGADHEFGTIEQRKRADLLILGANPLDDIRNTRSLETVIAEGRVVDRNMLQGGFR